MKESPPRSLSRVPLELKKMGHAGSMELPRRTTGFTADPPKIVDTTDN
jgi:hypothetical protein